MKPTIKTKGCIFDADGTLIDTSELIFQAFEHTLKCYHLPVPDRAKLFTLIGKPLEIDYTNVTGLTDTADFCKTHRAFQNENQHLVKLYPHVKETLDEIRNKGIWLSIVTTRSKITSIASLQQVNIYDKFDLVLSAEDVSQPKPNPESILKSLTHFGTLPEEALMIGDRKTDIEAGKNAQVATVAVSYGVEKETIAQSNPDYLVSDIREILKFI